MGLPDGDALDVIQRIKVTDDDIVIVAFSGWKHLEAAARAAGADAFIFEAGSGRCPVPISTHVEFECVYEFVQLSTIAVASAGVVEAMKRGFVAEDVGDLAAHGDDVNLSR